MNVTLKGARFGLSASTLKLIACLLMLVDHIGLQFFPHEPLFRIIGRLAFPIFAFFIAEGCYYTHSKLKRFLTVFILGVICESAYILYTGKLQGNILLTFSASILLIYCLQILKRSLRAGRMRRILPTALLTVVAFATAHPLAVLLDLDYGYTGVLLPVFVSLLDYKENEDPECFRSLDRIPWKVCALFVGLLILVYDKGFSSLQVWCLLAPLLLFFYNGKVGVRRFKYGFYLFYPVHLLLLELIALLLRK